MKKEWPNQMFINTTSLMAILLSGCPSTSVKTGLRLILSAALGLLSAFISSCSMSGYRQPALEPLRMAATEPREFNTEEYDHITENAFKTALQEPLSTFSIDVDNASYANVRRFLNMGKMPPIDAVRIEEMVNYFGYSYPDPGNEHPFSIYTEVSECPWKKGNRLVHIGLQGKSPDYEHIVPSNLVFLVDVSGSMQAPNKLPLLKKSLILLTEQLGAGDRVAIVAYAGAAGLVLPSTSADRQEKISKALRRLTAGGSTAGGAGINLAYDVAKENFMEGGNNRVILATDGDFNVGATSTGALVRLIQEKCKTGIYLSICGFGMGNYKDGRMEQISNIGNGNYFYIDSYKEARKVFLKEMRANIHTIAKDVKIQVEFNPLAVKAYRLIGYENRVLAKEDFNNDLKDAGELGAGHSVTALYEIVPAEAETSFPTVDPLRYQTTFLKTAGLLKEELMTVKLRYKPINSSKSLAISRVVKNQTRKLKEVSNNFNFSAAVAGFGMILRNSRYKGTLNYRKVLALSKKSLGEDEEGYRREFIELVETAASIMD